MGDGTDLNCPHCGRMHFAQRCRAWWDAELARVARLRAEGKLPPAIEVERDWRGGVIRKLKWN